MRFDRLIGLGMLAAPVAAIPVVATGSAEAQSSDPNPLITGSYVSVAVGQISGKDYNYTVEGLFPVEASMGDGYIIDAAYGMHFGNDWRAEVGFSWQDRDNADALWQFGSRTGPGLSAYSLDAIGYRDFRFNSLINLYIGAGLGLASVNIDDGVITDSTDTSINLQAIAGVEARVTSNLVVYTEARMRSLRVSVEAGQAGASGETDGFDITNTSLSAGVKLRL